MVCLLQIQTPGNIAYYLDDADYTVPTQQNMSFTAGQTDQVLLLVPQYSISVRGREHIPF